MDEDENLAHGTKVIKVEQSTEGKHVITENYRFVKIGEEVPLKTCPLFKFDVKNLPSRPLVVSDKHDLMFIAHNTGFYVVRISVAISAAVHLEKGDESLCIQDICLADIRIGQISVLALSDDSSKLAACVGCEIYFFSVTRLLNEGHGESFLKSVSLGSCIKDMQWIASDRKYVVLTNDGKLYTCQFYRPDGKYSFNSCLDNIDCVSWNKHVDCLAVVKENLIIILQLPFKEKLRIRLLFDTPNGEDDDGDCVVKVDSIGWVRMDCIMLGCYRLSPDGTEKNHFVQLISVKDFDITESSSNPMALNFRDLFLALDDNITNRSGPYTLLSYLDDFELAFAANKRNIYQNIVLFGWSSDKEGGPQVFELANDAWLPEIYLQADADDNNMILGLDIYNFGKNSNRYILCGEKLECCCILTCLTTDGKLFMFDFARAMPESVSAPKIKENLSGKMKQKIREKMKKWKRKMKKKLSQSSSDEEDLPERPAVRICIHCGQALPFYKTLNHERICKIERAHEAAEERELDAEVDLARLAQIRGHRNAARRKKQQRLQRELELFEKAIELEEAPKKRGAIVDGLAVRLREEREELAALAEAEEPEMDQTTLSRGFEWEDSEDDTVDVNEVDYNKEDYNSDDVMNSNDDSLESDSSSIFSLDVALIQHERNFTILKEEDIRKRQKKAVNEAYSLMSITRALAFLVLRRYNWSVTNAVEQWFNNEPQVRKSVGLLEKEYEKSPRAGKMLLCQICLDEYTPDKTYEAACGHPFCYKCWKGYIETSINGGHGCLTLGCPSCGVALGVDFICMMTRNEVKKKFQQFMLRSYIEDNPKAKWCPAPGCECAVVFDTMSENYDVTCDCSYSFCWNCCEEVHRPVDCETVKSWKNKNSADGRNEDWKAANTKPCPKCKTPIEKMQGCVHMTCKPPCKHQFCWLCLGPWSSHGEHTGGSYSCNTYQEAMKAGLYDESQHRIEMAKKAIKRYEHFYEHWDTNRKAKEKALDDLKEMQNVQLAVLAEKQCQSVKSLNFIIKAWLQIVECRRVLQWSYAYGYHLDEEEDRKTERFNFLQGEAKTALERLNCCAEIELMTYFNGDTVSPYEFLEFKEELVRLTSVTETHFKIFVTEMENNFEVVQPAVVQPEVVPQPVVQPEEEQPEVVQPEVVQQLEEAQPPEEVQPQREIPVKKKTKMRGSIKPRDRTSVTFLQQRRENNP